MLKMLMFASSVSHYSILPFSVHQCHLSVAFCHSFSFKCLLYVSLNSCKLLQLCHASTREKDTIETISKFHPGPNLINKNPACVFSDVGKYQTGSIKDFEDFCLSCSFSLWYKLHADFYLESFDN